MKKNKNVNPLDLDKEIIARLDEKQLKAFAVCANDWDEEDEGATLISFRDCKPNYDCCYTTPFPTKKII